MQDPVELFFKVTVKVFNCNNIFRRLYELLGFYQYIADVYRLYMYANGQYLFST